MTEILTEAVVLDKKPVAETDANVILYTKYLGKITARATGARKITSKLNAHLEPLNLVKVRIVYKNRYQITDALTIDRFKQFDKLSNALTMINFIEEMTVKEDNDYRLWHALRNSFYKGNLSYNELLKIFGFDPQFAVCAICGAKAKKFIVKDLSFLCGKCSAAGGLKKKIKNITFNQ